MSDSVSRFHEALRERLVAPPTRMPPTAAKPETGPTGSWPPAARRFRDALAGALARPAAAPARDMQVTASAASPLAQTFAHALKERISRPAGGVAEWSPSLGSSQPARRFAEALRCVLERQPGAAPEAAAGETAPAGRSPLAVRFDDELRRALDPANAGSTESARTTGHSHWLSDPCVVCGHTIREGDQVWLERRDGKIEPVHDSDELPCHSGASPAAPRPSPAAAAFSASLRRAYPGTPVLRVVRLLPGHPLLSNHAAGRARCRGCGHTFRPFERVSVCPCSPLTPRDGCRFPAHNDPAVSQLCFDLLADPARKHCPKDFSPR
jgi:hypothetical protein